MPAPTIPQRVTLLCSGVRAGNDLLALLGEERAVNVISAPLELARGGPPADVVVVDVPAEDRPAVCQELRYHYRGPLIVLLQPADNSHDLPPDRSRTLLTRPFSMRELAVALAASVPAPPASDPAGRLGLVPPHGTQEPRTNPAADWERTTVVQAVPRLVRSLGERRLVRVSAILAAAATAFIVAFGLANQGDRCPPRCHEPIGADDLTSTSSDTTVQAVGGGVADPATTDPSGRPTAVAGSRTDVATSGATRISTTTSPSSGIPGPTSSPDPTRPQPSASSTTAPTTTRPRPTTTTTTSSTTTTTTTDLSASARRW
jgi:hypothetical protein